MLDSTSKSKPLLTKILLGFLVIAAAFTAVFSFLQYQQTRDENPSKELDAILQEVGKSIELPAEIPTLATVTDKDLLVEQEFFHPAENGDKVLIYENWQKIILYRPATRKIVNFSSMNRQTAESSPTTNVPTYRNTTNPSPTPSPTPSNHSVALFNGTSINGLTQTAAELLSREAGVTITARQNAAKNTYTQTLVIPIKPTSQNMATNLAKILSGQVTTLPESEIAPEDADIVIILASSSATTNSGLSVETE